MTSRVSTRRPAWARQALAAAACSLLFAAGCRQDMHDAPRYDPLEESPLFANGASALPLVEGTVARGHLDEDTLLETGKVNGQFVDEYPFPITAADMDRG